MTMLESPARPGAPTSSAIAPERLRALQRGQRPLRLLARVLPPILIGYALLDRGFAYIHIPGTPIFAGEFLVLVSMAALAMGTGFVRRALEHSAVAKTLLLFAAWGVARTLPNLRTYGFDSIRDAALWYYALIAIPTAALIMSDRDLLQRWALGYRRFIPWLFLFSPIALYLSPAASNGLPPLVPGSGISIWDHKGANISVQVTIGLAFLWLVPGAGGRSRAWLTGLATLFLLYGATQGRSGFVAAMAGLGIVWVFSRRRGRLLAGMFATILLLLVLAWGFNVQVNGDQGRRVSVTQLAQNLTSVVRGNTATGSGNLGANVRFRDRLWAAVLHKVTADKRELTGLGFGPNIAKEVGFQGQGPVPLRSPHNSHLDIYARMGMIGLAIWISLWTLWLAVCLRTRSRLRALALRFEASIVEVCVVGVAAILINSYFDPTLESPQVAIWLWVLVGIALGLAGIGRRAAMAQAA